MAIFIPDTLISPQGLADLLQIERALLYRKWRSWGLPGLFVGGQLRFDPDDLELWLEQRKQAEAGVSSPSPRPGGKPESR